ncbi:hypothetical protein V8E36_001748 [Tilletia maclaganii]
MPSIKRESLSIISWPSPSTPLLKLFLSLPSYDRRQNLLCLAGDLFLLDAPLAYHELAIFDKACPSMRSKSKDEANTPDMLRARIANEGTLRRYRTKVNETKLAAFHLAGALNWFRACMSGCGVVDELLKAIPTTSVPPLPRRDPQSSPRRAGHPHPTPPGRKTANPPDRARFLRPPTTQMRDSVVPLPRTVRSQIKTAPCSRVVVRTHGLPTRRSVAFQARTTQSLQRPGHSGAALLLAAANGAPATTVRTSMTTRSTPSRSRRCISNVRHLLFCCRSRSECSPRRQLQRPFSTSEPQ